MAVGKTGITVVGVAVVASLARIDHAVTTAGQRAIVAAAVSRHITVVYARVAGLHLRLDKTVAAGSRHAVRKASVVVVRIAVIAGLGSIDHTVAAAGRHAIIATAVCRHITVVYTRVAGLDFRLHETVTTRRSLAVGKTSIAVVRVAVVADFARVDNAVAAASRRTIVATTICRHVTVVYTRIAGLDFLLHETVATGSRRTAGEAGVAIVSVAVVASLARVNHAVTAAGHRAIAATATCLYITIGRARVARLGSHLQIAITAGSRLAAGQAGITVVGVAVVAGLTNIDNSVTAGSHATVSATKVADLGTVTGARIAGLYADLYEAVAAERVLTFRCAAIIV